ncbi:MAG: YlxR family protein [Myxococcota bacterium]
MAVSRTEPMRTCVGCRLRQPMSGLLRLQVDSEGVLVPTLGVRAPGRSAWVCPTPKCVGRVQKNPKGLYRALRRKPAPKVVDLQGRLLAALWVQVWARVEHCRRSGLVVSGAQRLSEVEIVVLLVASDASLLTQTRLRAQVGQGVWVKTGVDRRALGALIGRGPRAALGFRDGRPVRLLLAILRQCIALS